MTAEWGETLLQFLHVLGACILVGSTFFVAFVLIPVLRKEMGDAERLKFLRAMGKRSRILMWSAIIVLFAVGFFRIGNISGGFIWETDYGRLLIRKISLAAVFVLLAFMHDFVLGARVARMNPSEPSYPKLRTATIVLAQVQFLVLLLIIFSSVRLRLYTW